MTWQEPNEREWSPDQAILPRVERHDDSIRIKNIRNCRYRTKDDYDVIHYDKTFDLSALRRLWFVRVPFSRLFAHVFVSFEFDGGEFLAVSVEARRKRGEPYSPIKGCFPSFGLMYVIGDERDLIGLRAVYRGDPVYLYPVNASGAFVQKFFLAMLARAESLRTRPEFYNSLFNNCMTNLRECANAVAPGTIPWDTSLVAPFYADKLLQRLHYLDDSVPLEALREHCLIKHSALAGGIGENFSKRIRTFDGS